MLKVSIGSGASPSRESAACATTIAPPGGTLERRVEMLPLRLWKRRSGRNQASWAWRRWLPVATKAPCANPARSLPTRASLGSPRRDGRQAEAGRRHRLEVLGRVHCRVGHAG